MKVGQRLFFAVIPAVLGVFTVAALAYFGQYEHTAPEALVLIAIIASVASLVVAWRNTRYVAQRIEHEVDTVGSQVIATNDGRRRGERGAWRWHPRGGDDDIAQPRRVG